MISIYKFYVDCGSMGFLSGIFPVTEKDIESIIGFEVYFGEVLGKHSEIVVKMEESHFTLVTSDTEFINKFVELDCSTGYNPFDYLETED